MQILTTFGQIVTSNLITSSQKIRSNGKKIQLKYSIVNPHKKLWKKHKENTLEDPKIEINFVHYLINKIMFYCINMKRIKNILTRLWSLFIVIDFNKEKNSSLKKLFRLLQEPKHPKSIALFQREKKFVSPVVSQLSNG